MVVAGFFAAGVVRPAIADLLEFFQPISCLPRELGRVGNLEEIGVKHAQQRREVEAVERGYIFLPDDARLLLREVSEDADIPPIGGDRQESRI